MKTNASDSFNKPSKAQLIWLSSFVITILLSVPRLLLLISEIQPHQIVLQEPVEWSTPFVFRVVFNFLFCLLFFTLNLQSGTKHVAGMRVDLNKFSQKLIANVIVLAVADFIIVGLHVLLFGPSMHQHVFIKAYSLVNLLILCLILIISQLYLQLIKNQQLKLTNEILNKENAESKFEVLKNQVNPHFLFNSFNTLRGIIHSKPLVAADFIDNMSDVFRYTLKSSKANLVRLSEEVQFVRAYLAIIKERFGSKIHITISIDQSSFRYFVPPLALQILAENVVKHNGMSEENPIHLHIFSRDSSHIIVSNQLRQRKDSSTSMGMGLYNLNERYKYLCGKQIGVEKTSDEFVVTIPLLPYENIDH